MSGEEYPKPVSVCEEVDEYRSRERYAYCRDEGRIFALEWETSMMLSNMYLHNYIQLAVRRSLA
jgi:hypothetical protein